MKLLNKAAWPVLLSRALPDLLTVLLQQRYHLSLERLQLVGCRIEFFNAEAKAVHLQIHNVRLIDEADDELLHLLADLDQEKRSILRLHVTYFKRGARRFFSPPTIKEPLAQLSQINFSLEDVQVFLQNTGQHNSFYLDEDLARLNGRIMLVPHQMILEYMTSQAMAMLEGDHRFMAFDINFHRSIAQGQVLNLSYRDGEDKFYLGLSSTDGNTIALLVAGNGPHGYFIPRQISVTT